MSCEFAIFWKTIWLNQLLVGQKGPHFWFSWKIQSVDTSKNILDLLENVLKAGWSKLSFEQIFECLSVFLCQSLIKLKTPASKNGESIEKMNNFFITSFSKFHRIPELNFFVSCKKVNLKNFHWVYFNIFLSRKLYIPLK